MERSGLAFRAAAAGLALLGCLYSLEVPTAEAATSVITIGTGTSTAVFPMGTSYDDERTEVIYLASQIGGAGTIRALALYVATVPGQTMNNWTIRLKHTSLSAFTMNPWETEWTTVYQGNVAPGTAGWRTFTLSTPFVYNGTDNLLADFSFNNATYSTDGTCRCSTPGGNRTMFGRSDSSYGVPLMWSGYDPTGYTSTSVPNLQLTIERASVVIATITPNSGASAGSVNITDLAGTGFQAGATVKLRRSGQSDINATAVTTVSPTRITCMVNLAGAAVGAWDVVVTNPDSASAMLTGGFSVTNPPRVFYVSPSGSDIGSGLTWAQAKKTVQAALNAATAGDQVWAAAGTYVECITLKAGVELYGGFAGGETNLAQRNWVANVTVLDGNRAGSVVTGPAGATSTTRIDGFTIRNGSGTVVAPITWGGGLYLNSSSPTIANNTITGNSVTGPGGALYLYWSSPTITNNTIRDNIASRDGGAMYLWESFPTIANNTITGNSTYGAGGGLNLLYSSPMIANNTITGNSATRGGGLYLGSSTPTITNNTIVANGGYEGGGLYLGSSYPPMSNNIVAFNSSGIHQQFSGTMVFRSNCVYGNTASNYSGMSDRTGTNGNISTDPMLAAVPYGNVHLQPGSPCIEAGSNSDVPAGWLDVDGQVRQIGAKVDIGADESDGTNWASGPAVTIRVRTDGNDANDGSSWPLARRTVQAAIDAAAKTGGDVWVAAGSYAERVTLRNNVHVYGGFAGNETSRDQRDWVARVTTLDGQYLGSAVTASAGGYGVSTIDGFTITRGSGTVSGPYVHGGGLYVYCCSPRIANNTITGNSVSGGGGGLYVYSSFPTIVNNTIRGNNGLVGGGLYVEWYSCPRMTSNAIAGNSTSSSGGGLYLGLYVAPWITSTTIAGNSAPSGGGLLLHTYSAPKITNSIVAFNSSGILRDSTNATPTIRYSCVYGNTAYNYSGLTDPTGTNGNLSVDPTLARLPSDGADGWGDNPATPGTNEGANDDYGNLHLQNGSPCINAGDPAFVPVAGETDMDGRARVASGRVDIGADEFGWPGDINGDGYVNVGDLQALVANWGTGP